MPDRAAVRLSGASPTARADGPWSRGWPTTHFAAERIRITTEELEAERADVADLLP